MALRNVPKSYTFDQQRQEINSLASDVGDITQLASGLPSIVAAINQIQAGLPNGGEILSGNGAPTAGDGANGDFWLDTSVNDFYGPKENGAWPASTISFSEQILSGVVAPLSTLGKLNDYYFDSAKKELYGPKTAQGWGTPSPLGEADYQNVLYVKPGGDDNNTGASPSKAFQTIKAAAKAAAAMDGNTTIRVATGKYYEDNPIYLPKGTSIVGDNLRETIVIPNNEGRDIFWVTSGCYINYMVFEDNFSGGIGYLETEPSDNRTLTAVDQTFRVLPGHTLQKIDGVFPDSGNTIEFRKTNLIASAIADMLAQFPALPSNPDYDLVTCERDLGYIVDGLVADLRSGGNVKSIQNGLAYRDANGELIAAIQGEEIELIYAIERLSYHAQQEILTNWSNDPGWTYSPIIQDTAGYPACARAQAYISTLENIVISIIQGGDIPPYYVGPGYILIDQEWMEVIDFNTTTNTFIVNRGVNDPITGEATVADRHITGAFVSQSAFTWRYAVAYPEQSGYRGKGRVNLQAGNTVVSGDVNTVFTAELQDGWSIRVNGNDYKIATVDTDGQLTLVDPVPAGQDATLDIYYVIPPKERIFLSPYT